MPFRAFSGTARYTLTLPRPTGTATTWRLDLGTVRETARVSLNGRPLAVLIGAPYVVDIPRDAFRARNELQVEVSNLMANRIADMDRRAVPWKRFYNVNMPASRPENRGPDGLFDAGEVGAARVGAAGPGDADADAGDVEGADLDVTEPARRPRGRSASCV